MIASKCKGVVSLVQVCCFWAVFIRDAGVEFDSERICEGKAGWNDRAVFTETDLKPASEPVWHSGIP